MDSLMAQAARRGQEMRPFPSLEEMLEQAETAGFGGRQQLWLSFVSLFGGFEAGNRGLLR